MYMSVNPSSSELPLRAPLRRRSYLGLDLTLDAGSDSPRVAEVDADSPAAHAGLMPGDLLISVAELPITNLDSARSVVRSAPTEEPSVVVIERDGARCELTVQARPMPIETLPSGRVELSEVMLPDHRLRAIWTFPEARGPFPAIWMLPGAAWLSEERPIAPGGALLELVRGLTAAGFATLRVDRSGLGDSEGPLCTETDLNAELAGWQAALAHLCAHPEVRQDRVFVYARSLGGMLAPLVVKGFAPRAVAVWGTSARRWSRAMLEGARRQHALAGTTGPALERILAAQERLHHWVYRAALTPERAFEQEPELRSLESLNFRGGQLYRRSAAFFQQLERVDVAQAWRELPCPLLALHGTSDWLSQLEDTIEIAELAPRGAYLELTGIDHMMHARASVEEAFSEPFTGTFCPKALEALIAFFRAQL